MRAAALALLVLAAACTPRIEPAGPRVAAPHLADKAFIAADGASLPVRRWLPEGEIRTVLIGVHGFNDYSHSFDGPGRFWAAKGIATYAYDQRGFGGSPNRGLWAGTETMTGDLREFVKTIRRRHPDLPVYVVGVSMGGAVALVAATDPDSLDVDGAILVAPAVWGRRKMQAFSRWVLWFFSRTLPWLTTSAEGLEIRPSDNIEMLRALGRDKMIIKYTRIDAIKGLVDLMDAALNAVPRVKLPVLYLYGAHDRVIPGKATFAAFETLSVNGTARAALYPDGYHMLLRDLNGEIPRRDIAHWIIERDAPLPSGADLRGAERRMLLAEQPTE